MIDVNRVSSLRSGGWFRWVICGLLFFAATINYIDRQVIGILKSELSSKLNWNDIDYSNVVFCFSMAYALGYLLAGRFIDRVGVYVGFAVAVIIWSHAAMAHGFVAAISLATLGTAVSLSVVGFCLARFMLGLAEGANFPASIKSVSEWFPKSERALATGIFNAGTNVGALVTPLMVPWLTVNWGVPAAFYVTGALGFVWLLFWLWLYDRPQDHPRVTAAELAYIQSDPPDPAVSVSWLSLLTHRQTWAFTVGMFMTSPVWWFYLYWAPDFLHRQHGLNLMQIGPPLVVIYLMTDVGSVAGGWLSSFLIQRGWSVNAGRKTAMLVCALCVVPVCLVGWTSNLWVAVLLIGLAASAHQGFSANLFTMASDTTPRFAVSSVVGIGGMAGAIGGMIVAKVVGYVLQWTGGRYAFLFLGASVAYLVVLTIIHLLNPRLAPMELETKK